MRYLVFRRDDESKVNYQILYTALVGKENYTRPQIRLMNAIAAKFDKIGVAKDSSGIRELAIFEGLEYDWVELQDGEYALLNEALDSITFRGVAHTLVVRTLDFFENAPTKLPKVNDGEVLTGDSGPISND